MFARLRHVLQLALFVLIAVPGISFGQFGTSYCVGTTSELAQAIASANASSELLTLIRVGAGVYTSTANEFSVTLTKPNRTVYLIGGYQYPGCASRQRGAHSGTLLRGNTNSSALYVNTGPANSGNKVLVQDLIVDKVGADNLPCLRGFVSVGTTLEASGLLVQSCKPSAVLMDAFGAVNMDNVVVAGNQSSPYPVELFAYDSGAIRLRQMTVTGNSGTTCGGLHLTTFGGATIDVRNSIVWGNAVPVGVADICTSGSGISLTRVHYTSHSGDSVSESTSSNGDPRFVSPTNPRLRNDSPLINTGLAGDTSLVGDFDADGATRVQGAAVDVGALEVDPDRVFADEFETWFDAPNND